MDVLGQTLIVGRRTNVKWRNNDLLHHPINVTLVARKRGVLFSHGADYFIIAKNAFPWRKIPDFVIARDGYDGFLVASAIKNNVSVVDATATILAVHQTDKEGNFAGGSNARDTLFNKKLMGYYHYTMGHTKAAPYETRIVSKEDNTMAVVVKKRKLKRRKLLP